MVKKFPFLDDLRSRMLPEFIFHVKENMKIDQKLTNSIHLK